MFWQDAFGFADSYDETAGRYLGLRGGTLVMTPLKGADGQVYAPAEHGAARQVPCAGEPVAAAAS